MINTYCILFSELKYTVNLPQKYEFLLLQSLVTKILSCISHIYDQLWAFQVVLVVKNPPANAGHLRNSGSISWLGASSGGGRGNPLQYSCLRIPWTKNPGELWFLESQRDRHD